MQKRRTGERLAIHNRYPGKRVDRWRARQCNQAQRRIKVYVFFILLIVAVGLAGFAAYDKFNASHKNISLGTIAKTDEKLPFIDSNTIVADKLIKELKEKPIQKKNPILLTASHKPKRKLMPAADSLSVRHKRTFNNQYTILRDAYFYDAPDKNKRSDIYLTAGDATLTFTEESGDFQYAIFTDDSGKSIKGWLLKKDFKTASDY